MSFLLFKCFRRNSKVNLWDSQQNILFYLYYPDFPMYTHIFLHVWRSAITQENTIFTFSSMWYGFIMRHLYGHDGKRVYNVSSRLHWSLYCPSTQHSRRTSRNGRIHMQMLVGYFFLYLFHSYRLPFISDHHLEVPINFFLFVFQ